MSDLSSSVAPASVPVISTKKEPAGTPALRDKEGCVPAWCADYMAIPFLSGGRDRAGCDCYGLVRLVLRERFGVEVPSYAGEYPDALEYAEVAALISRCLLALPVAEDGLWCEIANPVPGAVILLRIAGEPWHVGVIVAERWFLHVRPGTDSCLERYDSIRWRRRIAGFYRYVG